MEKYTIKIESGGKEAQAIAYVERLGGNDLRLSIDVDGSRFEKVDFDCLTAFNFIRKEYFPHVKFLCNGARENFVQSGMMQQSGGFYGYLVALGQHPSSETAFIFDYCPPDFITTVDQQEKFKAQWYESLSQ
jgi:hypothetical protein